MKSAYLILFSVMLSTLLFRCADQQTEKKTNGQPNVIFILADDLGYGDLSCYGQEHFQTPNIDQLAKQGMLFTQHYAGATVCAPSRSSLLTGQHTGHTPIRGNNEVIPEGQFPMADSVYTVAELFQKAGYRTGVYGKWGLGYPGSEGDPLNQGFDEFYGYNCQRLAHHYYPYFLRRNDQVDSLEANRGNLKGAFAPNLIHKEVLTFIDQNKNRPFFLFYASPIPHAELIAPDSIMDKYRGEFLPESSYQGLDEGPKYRQGAYESQNEAHAAFAAMMEILDRQVGEIVDKVEELGISENTIIIFTSDNGPHQEGGADPDYFDSNGRLKGYKRDLYEGGIRVPLIIKWDTKIPQNSKSDHISAFWDFPATFEDILRIDSLKNTNWDGLSFYPTLIGASEQPNHDYLYWEFHELGGRQAVRKGNWKAVRYRVFDDPDSQPELYDLSTDIGEQYNRAKEYPEIANELSRLMDESRIDSKIFDFTGNNYDKIQ